MTEAAFCTREGEQTGHTHKRDSTYSLDKINHRLPKKTIEGKWNCHPGFWKLRIVPGDNERKKNAFCFLFDSFSGTLADYSSGFIFSSLPPNLHGSSAQCRLGLSVARLMTCRSVPGARTGVKPYCTHLSLFSGFLSLKEKQSYFLFSRLAGKKKKKNTSRRCTLMAVSFYRYYM